MGLSELGSRAEHDSPPICRSITVDEEQSSQSVWMEDTRSCASPRDNMQSSEASVTCGYMSTPILLAAATPSNYQIEPDLSHEDEFGESVLASTDTFKQPIFHTTEEDETFTLLNVESDPNLLIGLFQGVGLMESVWMRLDISTLALRRAGKLALRKLMIKREMQMLTREANNEMVCGLRRMPIKNNNDATERADTAGDGEVTNEYLDKPEPIDSTAYLNGLMRPVCHVRSVFPEAQPERSKGINDLVTAEINVWTELP